MASRPLRSSRALPDELPELLRAQGLSINAIGRRVDVDPTHLSRVIRRHAAKRVSGELAARIAVALGLPVDYWPEYREAFVIKAIREDAALRDRIYEALIGGEETDT